MLKLPPVEEKYKSRFVPTDLDFTNMEAVLAFARKLSERDVSTPEFLIAWIRNTEEFEGCFDEAATIAEVDFTCDTADEAKKARCEYFAQKLLPALKPIFFEWSNKYCQSPAREPLDMNFWSIHDRKMETEVRLFREENIPLGIRENELEQQFQEIAGAMTALWEDEDLPLPRLESVLEKTHRDVRERACRLAWERRAQDADQLNDIFDELIQIRHQIAVNAGFGNYRDYIFVEKLRWDYTSQDCTTFHDAIARVVVPVIVRLAEQRSKQLKITNLKPWDFAVDPSGRPPLKPFSTQEELLAGAERVFARFPDPKFLEYFLTMERGNLFDLESRRGKAPGGYMTSFAVRRLPFIFMNAAGTHGDVDTLHHEAGHSFHFFETRNMEHRSYCWPTSEMSEVASMSMELLARKYFGEFYSDEEDLRRALRKTIVVTIETLPWIACIDKFQHWIYTNPKHTRDERSDRWLELLGEFMPEVCWDGLEDFARIRWQKQLHLFLYPFYYIEYGVAQLGALQVWRNSLEDERDALEKYRYALSLGGSRSLPELFKAAGAELAFDEATIRPLVEAVMSELT